MNKFNKKGFFLSEALIVSVIVTAVITGLYVIVIGIINNYNNRSYYDNVSSLYMADNIRTLIYEKGVDYFSGKLGSNSYYLVTCNDFIDELYPGSVELCNYVFNYGLEGNEVGSVVVDKVIFTKYDITGLKNDEDAMKKFEGTTSDYIDTIPVVSDSADYRIILILKEREQVDDKKAKHWYTTLRVVR